MKGRERKHPGNKFVVTGLKALDGVHLCPKRCGKIRKIIFDI